MGNDSLPIRDVTVGALLSRLAHAVPDREALVYSHSGKRWTFRALDEEARLVARGLVGHGVKPGDRVAVLATNVPEWVVLQFALAKIGAILVTVNTALRAQEIEYLLRQSETSTLVTIAGFRSVNYLAELRSIGAVGSDDARKERLPHLERVVFVGRDCPEGLIPYQALAAAAANVPPGDLDALGSAINLDDVINMQFTSGTTGFPKGVMLSSRNIVNNGFWLGQGLGFTPDDRLCLCVPLFHCFGCVIGVLGAFTHGACLCAVEWFEPRRVLETIERERCTAVYGVPTMFLAELEEPDFERFDLSSLRTGIMAGALCPDDCLRIDRNIARTDPDSARRRHRRTHADRGARSARGRNAHRGSGDGRRRCVWPARRALGARLHGDEGLLQHAGADRGRDYARRLAAQRRSSFPRR
jgi:fatty-acyl-CoA synthase